MELEYLPCLLGQGSSVEVSLASGDVLGEGNLLWGIGRKGKGTRSWWKQDFL